MHSNVGLLGEAGHQTVFWLVFCSMKLLIAILWVQTFAGFWGVILAYDQMDSGTRAYEWTTRVQAEYERLAAAPDFKPPPEVDGLKHERLPAAFHALAFTGLQNARFSFAFAGGVACAGVVMLFLAYCAQRNLGLRASRPIPAGIG